LAKDKIFNGRLIIERVKIVTSILIVEREVGPRAPPLIVEVVVAELKDQYGEPERGGVNGSR
jgi:hypothetical protein